jgi:hypothetical protein
MEGNSRINGAIALRWFSTVKFTIIVNYEGAYSIGDIHSPMNATARLSLRFIWNQELLPALLTGLATMFPEMTLDERMLLVARLCAQQPAQIYGLSHRKGTLLPGFDADITVVDSQQRWRVQPANLYTQCGWSAYEGWLFIGLPILTVRRGTIVYERRSDGTENFGAPDGAFITPRRAISPLAPV